MKSRLNYKSRKTIIITAIIIALLALSATGIYMFTKGNDEAKAFTEGNTMVEGSESPVVIPEQGNTPEEPTVEPNTGSENNEEQTPNGATTNAPQTGAQAGTTTSTTAPNVPNQEYVTERQEEVERLTEENFLVSWNPISLAGIATNIDLDELNEEAKYEVSKVATLVNGEAIRNENGEFTTRVKAGDEVTYVITVKNTGKVTIKNIEVVDELADYKATIPVLAIGDSKELEVSYTVKQEDMTKNDTIVNVAKVTIPGKPEEEPKEEIPSDPYITVSGSKTWVDNRNAESTRPASITVEVLNGETVVDTIAVTPDKDGNWTYTSKELPKYDSSNNEINYTVRETNVDVKYTAAVSEDGRTIVNTLKDSETATVTISGNKTWVDNGNVENTRPASITVEVLNGETVVDTITVTPDSNGNWTYISKELPKYENKETITPINYTVRETNVNAKYTAAVSEDGRTIVNTLKDSEIATVTISGNKTWVDNGNAESTRPASITVEVLNGETVVDTITVTPNENGNWAYTSKALPKYADKETTTPITYTVREKDVDSKYIPSAGTEKYDIVNTLKDSETATVTVSGNKTWVDNGNAGNTRPASIIVEVLNGETVVDTITVTPNENGNWAYTSKALPKYANKETTTPINYTVRETNVDTKYSAAVSEEDGRTIVNTLKDEYTVKTKIIVNKVWSDINNQDGKRNTEIKVQLYANQVKQGEPITLTASNKVGEDNNLWQVEIPNLPKYANKTTTEPINYTIKEIGETNGVYGDYKVTYEGPSYNVENNEYSVRIENSYTPATESITVTKVWEDNNNEAQVRPNDITIKLDNGNTLINKTPTVNKSGNTWTYTFNDLPKYNLGHLITYTAKELRADGTVVANNGEYNDNYVTTYNGNTITNTYVKPEITVRKTSDKTNQNLKYGDTITYTLKAENTGTKEGKVTIKDTIPTGTELTGTINVTVEGTTTIITTEQLATGYEITVNKKSEATITFSVIVKAYAGEKPTNIGYYKLGDNPETPIDQPTDTVIVNVVDEGMVIPTITTTTPVTVPQKAILVLDLSGSMNDKIKVSGNKWNAVYKTKLELMKTAVNTFLTQFLDGKNEVMVITYSSDVINVCDFTKDKTTAYNSIGTANGGTNIDAGLTEANKHITESNAATTSVILMTDGLPGRHIDNDTGENIRESDGNSYNAKAGNAAIESAGWIKTKGSKVYSIGFGLDSTKGENMLQKIASPTSYNADGTVNTQYYYGTFDGEALEEAFENITNSITTTTNADPITVDTDNNGIMNITAGFKEGQNVEIYTGIYNKDTSEPVVTYKWEQFKALEYTTYASNQITFNLGKYMKDNGMAANAEVSLRFVDVAE